MKKITATADLSPSVVETVEALHKRLNDDFARRLNEYAEKLKNANNLNLNDMEKVLNEDNLAFLQSQLKQHGFPESVLPDLEKNLRIDQTEFILNLKMQSQNQVLEVSPYFKRGEDSDKFFFNHYKATLQPSEEIPEARVHKFYINNWSGATLREAFNLLKEEGPVNRNLFPSNAKGQIPWSALDLTQKTENGNFKIITYPSFNLLKELMQYPIKELEDELKMDSLLKSLKRGNAQVVSVDRPGGEESVQLKVNAREGTVDVYNITGVKMNETLKQEMEYQSNLAKDQLQQKSEGMTEKTAGAGQDSVSWKKEDQKQGAGEDFKKEQQNSQKNEKAIGKINGDKVKSTSQKVKTEKIKELLPQKEHPGTKKGLSL